MQRMQRNKGMTLLELVISMTISIIVVLMIISYISATFHIFRKTNDQVNLQMEAQTSMNQLVNLIMEAKAVSVETVIQPDTDIRYLIDNIDLAGYHDYAVIWRKDYQKLYLVEMIPPMINLEDITFDTEQNFDQEYLMAEYVDNFTITSDVDHIDLKTLSIHMTLGKEEYEISKDITLRNAD